MDNERLLDISRILKQVGGPVKISYQIKQVTLITEELVLFHIKKIEILLKERKSFYEEYSVSEIYSLYMCLSFIINDLGVDEFETIIGEDFFSFGLKLLSHIKQEILNYSDK